MQYISAMATQCHSYASEVSYRVSIPSGYGTSSHVSWYHVENMNRKAVGFGKDSDSIILVSRMYSLRLVVDLWPRGHQPSGRCCECTLLADPAAPTPWPTRFAMR